MKWDFEANISMGEKPPPLPHHAIPLFVLTVYGMYTYWVVKDRSSFQSLRQCSRDITVLQ